MAAGFCFGRSYDTVDAPRRRGDGVWAAGVCQCGSSLALLLGAGSSAQESYTDPTTLFVSSVVDIVRLEFPHKLLLSGSSVISNESGS